MATARAIRSIAFMLTVWYGSPLLAETVVHDTSAEFAAGTMSNVEDIGSGVSPAIRAVYELPFGFGDGRNGSPTISGDPNTRASCSGTGGSTTLNTGLNAQPGDIVLIHQTRGTNAGYWEFNKVVSDNGSSLTVTNALARTYYDDGGYLLGGNRNQAQAILVPQYGDLTITGGGPGVWYSGSDVGGIYAVMCSGTLTVSGTLNAASKGYGQPPIQSTGSNDGKQGESYDREGSVGQTAANATGGGAGRGQGDGDRGGGGGGGHASNGANGTGGRWGTGGGTVGDGTMTTIYMGGGGGNGGGQSGGDDTVPGAGGGIVFVVARNVVLSSGITVNGGNGTSGNSGAGGGAGGAVFIKAHATTLGSSLITATGGGGGSGGGYNGGSGGVGRIRVEQGTGTHSGNSNPGATFATLPLRTAGTYLSPAIHVPGITSFGTLLWSSTGSGTIQIRTRTASSEAGLSGAAWSTHLTASGQNITSDALPYVQYEASFAGTTTTTPVLNSLTINYQTNNRPTDPQYVSPADGAYLSDNSPLCVWNPSTDLDNDPLTYEFTLSQNADLSSPLVSTNIGSNTQYQTASLGEGTYYWRARAWDTKDFNENPSVWSFTVDTIPPGTLTIGGLFWDLGAEAITRVHGSGENGTSLDFYDENDDPRSGISTWDGAGNFTFAPDTPLAAGSIIYAVATDLADNTTASDRHALAFENARNIYKDTVVFHGTGPGASMRLERDTRYTFKVAVNGGSLVTVTAHLRYNTTYQASGAPLPASSLLGLGVNGSTTMSAGPADDWRELVVSGTPNADGVLTLSVETFSTAAGAQTWIDNISISQ